MLTLFLSSVKTQKRTFEINPKHPLIEGLLEKVEEVEGDEAGEAELRETVAVLWSVLSPISWLALD